MERKEETRIVKQALKAAGINAKVGHGKGTAWGWLHVNVGSSEQFGECVKDVYYSHRDCIPCQKIHQIADHALQVTKEVTGRHGEYDGNVNIYTQKHWTDKNGEVEILQTAYPFSQPN